MSDLQCESNNKHIIDNCMLIINAETKPLTTKPSKNAQLTMGIDDKRDILGINKLQNQTNESYLEDLFKSI